MKKSSLITDNNLMRTCKGYFKNFHNKWLLLLLVVVFAAGCKKVMEEAGFHGVCPAVISTSPIDTAIGTSLNSKVSATFNEEMNASTINAKSFTLTQGATPIAGTITCDGTTATFSPINNLKSGTVYTGTITSDVEDRNGNAMISNYVWNFTTGDGPDIIAPTVTTTDPANAATAVALNKNISATFSEAMDSLSVTTSFTITNTTSGGTIVDGAVSYIGTTAVFAPAANLLPNTTYTGTITTGAKDVTGNELKGIYVWSFTTGATSDVIAPTVISTVPANRATAVAFNTKVSATFSEAMDPSTITAATFILKAGATAISGLVTYVGSTATFTAPANLLPNTTYTGTITTGAKDLAGNAVAANYVWSFTTGATPDMIAPTVVSTVPPNGATGVAFNTKISASFSEAMDPSAITSTTFTLQKGTTAIQGTVTYVGTTATFSPGANLLPNTTYTGTITTGAKDLAGNALATNYIWKFTTSASPDVTRPTVTSSDPVNAANGVLGDKKISANFSEAMNSLSVTTATFTLKNGAAVVTGNVTYAGTKATFSPSVNLLAGTTYTATITTGAKDLAGNTLATNYVWSFTTLALPPIVAPNILASASIYGAFGGSAGITNQGLNTVINNGSIGTTGASTLITGFHDATTGGIYTETPLNVGKVTGRIYTAPPAPGNATSFTTATKGLADATIAYNSISPASKPGGTDPGAGELGGLTLAPGVYKSASGTFKITNSNLTLDAKGDPNAVWIFQTAAGLTVGVAGPQGARSVNMINGGLAKNVFWYVGSAAVINGAGGGVMTGNIIASAGVTFSTAGNAVQTVLNGRALSLNASVTMVNTTINVPQ
ncbi:Ig-like domain-containing protein [Segetibacter koreensis]|uniref:Ig-like domain-containing protein n=1 Tax=Segetibacter koreensis TaxID=398037 RepID=UPI00037916BA|nr:Ig-like domain-containing protein [Segetibacter koreensis]